MHLRLRTSRSAERCPKSGRKPEYSRPDARNGRPRVRDEQGGRRVASRRAAAARKAYPSRAEIRAAARSVCRPAAPAPLTPCGGGLCGLPRGFPRRAACGFSVLQWKPLDRLFPFVPRCRGFHVCANCGGGLTAPVLCFVRSRFRIGEHPQGAGVPHDSGESGGLRPCELRASGERDASPHEPHALRSPRRRGASASGRGGGFRRAVRSQLRRPGGGLTSGAVRCGRFVAGAGMPPAARGGDIAEACRKSVGRAKEGRGAGALRRGPHLRTPQSRTGDRKGGAPDEFSDIRRRRERRRCVPAKPTGQAPRGRRTGGLECKL